MRVIEQESVLYSGGSTLLDMGWNSWNVEYANMLCLYVERWLVKAVSSTMLLEWRLDFPKLWVEDNGVLLVENMTKHQP